MEMSGEQTIPAPRQTVWDMLNDVAVLQTCIPGCQSLDWAGDDALTGSVTAKVGPVKATFKGDVTLSDLNPPESYTISGQGKGGAAGFAKGSADITLTETDDGAATILRYAVKASVGGKLAQVGSRLVDSTARKYADQFFAALTDQVTGGAQSEAAPESPAEAAESQEPAPAPAAEPAQPTDSGGATAPEKTPPAQERLAGLPLPVWLGGVSVAIIVALLWLFFGG